MNKKDFFAAATGWDLSALEAALATRPDPAAAQDRRGRTGLDPVIHGSGQAGWEPGRTRQAARTKDLHPLAFARPRWHLPAH